MHFRIVILKCIFLLCTKNFVFLLAFAYKNRPRTAVCKIAYPIFDFVKKKTFAGEFGSHRQTPYKSCCFYTLAIWVFVTLIKIMQNCIVCKIAYPIFTVQIRLCSPCLPLPLSELHPKLPRSGSRLPCPSHG